MSFKKSHSIPPLMMLLQNEKPNTQKTNLNFNIHRRKKRLWGLLTQWALDLNQVWKNERKVVNATCTKKNEQTNRGLWNLRLRCWLFTLTLSPPVDFSSASSSVRSLSLSLSLSLSYTMQSAMALSFSQTSFTRPNHVLGSTGSVFSTPTSLRFCGLRREAFGFSPSNQLALNSDRIQFPSRKSFQVSASASSNGNGAPPKSFDYDLIIIGAGVGGHGAALHAVEKVLKLLVNCLNMICECFLFHFWNKKICSAYIFMETLAILFVLGT